MTDTLSTALQRAAEPREAKQVRDLIERMEPELVRSLQSPEAAAVLMRHYLTAIRLTPKLLACSQESLLAALLLSAQVRLEPGPLGHVYLVPHKAECVWVLGYSGIIELARRSGQVAQLRSRVVWTNDECRVWEDERGEHFTYTEGDEAGHVERAFVLVTWRELVGGRTFPRVVKVPRSRVERARSASPAGRSNAGPWVTDETAMWSKTGIRAVRPWLPLTPEAGYALASDDAVVVGLETDAEGAAQPTLMEREG